LGLLGFSQLQRCNASGAKSKYEPNTSKIIPHLNKLAPREPVEIMAPENASALKL